ncbi:MAG: alpha/beta hydrolase [Rhizobiales bacterium 62-17]|nr:alpha/beta hydrolase [Hyphomicrobiales bacterium]OJY04135.1 MAG: alpha/beta hydrolase [Rhizobiales bacterium 62-17]
MTHFVLIHGAWHTGEHWAPVAKRLEQLGHKVTAPTVLGPGKGVDKNVTHAQQIADLVNQITKADLKDFVLAGHSYGGTIISRLAEEIPDRIRRLVFWNAFVPLPGNSLDDETPPHYRALFKQLSDASADRTVTMPFPIWREAFMNDADEALAKSAYETLSSEPYQPLIDKLDLKRFYETKIPKSYLNCTEDIALPPGEWGWHPRMSSRLGLYRLVQMPGSHEVLFTNPVGLADKLVEAGRD